MNSTNFYRPKRLSNENVRNESFQTIEVSDYRKKWLPCFGSASRLAIVQALQVEYITRQSSKYNETIDEVILLLLVS